MGKYPGQDFFKREFFVGGQIPFDNDAGAAPDAFELGVGEDVDADGRVGGDDFIIGDFENGDVVIDHEGEFDDDDSEAGLL